MVFTKKSLRSLRSLRPYVVARSLVSGATPRATTELRTHGAADGTAQCGAGGPEAPPLWKTGAGGRGVAQLPKQRAVGKQSFDKELNEKKERTFWILIIYMYIYIYIIYIYVIIFGSSALYSRMITMFDFGGV